MPVRPRPFITPAMVTVLLVVAVIGIIAFVRLRDPKPPLPPEPEPEPKPPPQPVSDTQLREVDLIVPMLLVGSTTERRAVHGRVRVQGC